ncbi:hypothetical protein SEA_KELA_245 [Streptomyces phage Kela]|nr:hypothetical protein SEA_KELA_245 [Streptomyces phage Kela]
MSYERATEQSLADLNRAAGLLGEYPTAFCSTLEQARLTKEMIERWARMGRFDIDFLNRAGGTETIQLAREINRIGEELT